MSDMTDKKFLSSSVIKNRIIKELKSNGVSISVKNDIVTFKKNGKSVKKGYGLLDLDIDDIDSEDLHYQEYIDYVVKYVIITLKEMED